MPSAIDIRRFPWTSRLAADYAYTFQTLAPFFAGDPAQPAAWVDAIRRAQAYPRDRSALAAAVARQQERRGAPSEARAAAARLAEPDAVAVVTGQQAGLFGGPLYTLLKALTAVRLAARASAQHGVPVVPVFWVESEDHDWQEVGACAVLDAEMNRRAIALGTPHGAGEVPVSSVVLDPSILAAIDGLRALLPPTEFTAGTIDGLAAAYRPGIGMSEAFATLLESLLGRLGLVVYDGSEPATKPLVADLFARELEAPATARLALAQGRALEALGYHAQVMPPEDGVALFALDDARRPIRVRDGAFAVDNTPVRSADLVERARREPGRFSPNVLLRPIVQDALFPTACYVGGPSELAYQAELGPVYRHFGVPQPLVAARASATLLDAAAAKFLEKHALPLEALQPDNEAVLNRLLEASIPREVEQARERAVQAVESAMTGLIDALPSVDATLAGAARSSLGRMQHDLRTLHEKIVQAAKRRDDTLRRQFARTRALAFPDGHPQERAVGFVSFLNRYGPALIDRLHDDLPLEAGTHWVLTP